MVMTIDVPDNALKQAETRGIPVEELLREKFADLPNVEEAPCNPDETLFPGFSRFGPGTKTPMEAAASMREMAKRYTLDGTVTIKELIEEGRRY